MSSSNQLQCQNVLKNYFNNIIMLDDDFRFIFRDSINKDNNIAGFELPLGEIDPAAMDVINDFENNLITEEPKPIDESISNVLYYCREKNMNLFPYEFKDIKSFNVSQFIDFARRFTWIILDWNIPDQIPLYHEVLKAFGSDKRLRFITIYTDDDNLDPITETVLNIAKELSLNIDIISGKNHLYQTGSAIIFFQKKQECELSNLLDVFSLNMLDNFGELFLAVLQYAQVIEERSSEVLKNTANPFKILTLLQVLKNDTTMEGFNKELNKVISENILAFATLPVETTEYIKENVIGFVKEYTKKGTVIKDCRDCYEGKADKMPKFIEKCNDDKLFHNLKENNIDALFEYFNEMNYSGIKSDRLSEPKILGNISNLSKNEYPTILDCIIIGSLKPHADVSLKKHYSEALLKLLEFIKFDKYEGNAIFEERLNKGGIELNNLFSLGDIFERKERSTEFYDYLLCVTPECDAVRLSSSTDQKVIFVPGREISWDKFKNLMSNGNGNGEGNAKLKKFASVLPCCKKEGEYVVPVEWEFFSVHTFDLKSHEDKDEIKAYQRYYKMRYEYAKQVQAKFISYFLRNGVDELFIKDKNVSFGNMLIDMVM